MKREESYRHGGVNRDDFTRFNISERRVVDFSVNLNPLGPPSLIRERWGDLWREIEPYPTVNGGGISHYYEQRYGIPPEEFAAGNGSTEMIYLVPRALGLRRVVVVTPSYHDYTRACLLAGASVVHCPLSRGEDSFSLPLEGLEENMKEADALWLGNPNNPTGTLFPGEFLQDLAARFREKWILVDEAFMPFVEGGETHSLMVPGRPGNVLVLHSLTKFYALAGIRMGGLTAKREVIDKIRRMKEPWTVNGVAEKIAPLLLECPDYEAQTISLIREEKDRLYHRLKEIKGLAPFRPAVNFILCQWGLTGDLEDLARGLLHHGMYVRDCRNFPGLEKNWFRTAVRVPEENDRLTHAIASLGLKADG